MMREFLINKNIHVPQPFLQVNLC